MSPTPTASILIDVNRTTSTLASGLPIAGTPASDDKAIGYARGLLRQAPYSKFNSELTRGNTSFTSIYERPLTDAVSLRVGANYYMARRWEFNQNGNGWGTTIAVNTPGTGSQPTATTGNVQAQRASAPQKGIIFEDGGSLQTDFLAKYSLFDGAVKNNTMWTIDFSDYYRIDPNSNVGPSGYLTAWNTARNVPLIYDPITRDVTFRDESAITYYDLPFDWSNRDPQRYTKRRITVLGTLLRHQANFLNDRLLTFVGARMDIARFRNTDYNGRGSTSSTPWVNSFWGLPESNNAARLPYSAKRTEVEVKPNLGVNYKVNDNWRVFANYSESYFIDQQLTAQDIGDPTFVPETAAGYDYGVKASFLDERLNFTLTGYYITRENVVTQVIVPDPFAAVGSGNTITVNARDGNQLVRGWESELSYRFNDDWTIGASVGHTKSIYTYYGVSSPRAVGRRVQNITPTNGGAYFKWAPGQGVMKGFSVNVGVSYLAATPTELGNAGDVYAKDSGGFLLDNNGNRIKDSGLPPKFLYSSDQWALQVPSYTVWELGARYKLPYRAAKLEHTIGLNVKNLFDLDYIRTNRQLGDKRTFLVNYTIKHY
jgi:outer membrane receptor protein involved in Fe transport